MTNWDPHAYNRFEAERRRPAEDLAARIPRREVSTAMDLGCGTGFSTTVPADKFPRARIAGLDKSPAMIAAARLDFPRLFVVAARQG